MNGSTVLGLWAFLLCGVWLLTGVISAYTQAWQPAAWFAALGVMGVVVGDRTASG